MITEKELVILYVHHYKYICIKNNANKRKWEKKSKIFLTCKRMKIREKVAQFEKFTKTNFSKLYRLLQWLSFYNKNKFPKKKNNFR